MTPARTALAAALALGLAAAAPADDSTLKVKAGDKFPDVPLEAAQIDKVKKGGKTLSAADLKGKVAVIFFYPKASTKGCTIESCGFRDLAGEFPTDVVLVGASVDGMDAQNKFIKENDLPFPLLCDTDHKLVKALGIEKGSVSQRVTFLVDRDGVVRKVYTTVTPAKHPKEVLADARELAKTK